ncbi:MAG: SPOR domain-containing protein [Rikenellaceae bacterium]|nr:SPOR domain-containing protein [Rikenellaceae bacterium]
MATVDKIIYNALSARKVVEIPEVGVLKVVSTPARKDEKGNMLPPSSELVCVAQDATAVSVVDLIAEVGGVGKEQAAILFEEWKASASKPEGVVIEGVGVVLAGVLSVDATFAAKLNPTAPERRHKAPVKWLWILLLVAVGIGAWWTYAYWDVVKVRIWGCETEMVQKADSTEVSHDPVVDNPLGAQSAEGDQSGYHVIVGVFDVEANADRMIARMAEEGYTSTYKFIPGRARFWVTVGRFTDESDAIRLKREIDEIVPDVWVYPYHIYNLEK